jgi:hypothetical protein
VIARLGLAAALLSAAVPAHAAAVLFDATKHEMAGNADWVVDADLHDLNMPAYPCSGSTNESRPARFPTPPASGITAATPETYWTGGISSWGVELVKAGHSVETLPPGAAITFGDAGNPQDLSRYDLFILVEPQNPFTASEKAAILAYVSAGGGLFLVADHETSDRDCDGWDAPHVYNDLTGALSGSAAGAFGIWFRVNGVEDQGGEDWFDDAVDSNVETSPADPIIQGPFGSGAGGLGLFGSTSMDLSPADNPSVAAHVWRTGQAHGTTRVTFATAAYGSGRVAAIGDSSPADDDTGDPGDSLHPGWDKASGGVANREIHLNASHWLIDAPPDTAAPVITAGPAAVPRDCTALLTWSTDEPATSAVEFGTTPSYGSSASVAGLTRDHEVPLSGLPPASEIHFRVLSSDGPGNGPTASDDASFTTAAAAAPLITTGPSVSGTTVSWTTDEPATSLVDYGTTATYGSQASGPPGVTSHAVPLTGLAPETEYHYRVSSTDTCGNGPTQSADGTLTTGPASIDVSGWVLKQFTSTQTFTIPAGTSIPAGGYLVVARDATLAEFQAAHPGFPPGTVYLDSNANGACSTAGCFPQINGDETFELYDAGSVKLDGATIAMSTTHRAYQRNHPQDPAGVAGSWTLVDESLANPGSGAGSGNGAGVRINEMADAADFTQEYVELFYDATTATPDTTAPAAITNLDAVPTSTTTIRLSWTAPGDDGSTGTAVSYDIRRSSHPIVNEADFAAATPLAGAPSPLPAGAAQIFNVSGLATDTGYHFAMKTADDASNVSARSNTVSAVTAASGGGSTINHLVVSQIRVAGATDDAVELFNPTASSISLAGTSIQYLAANGNFGFRVNLNAAASVPARGWYLVAANGYAGSPARDDSIGASNMSNSAGHALLVAKTTNVSGCSDALIIDKVGYGATATCPEGGSGHATTTPGAGSSVTRKPGDASGNGQDTDVNDADFAGPAAPTFRNTGSTPAAPPAALGNVRNTLYLSKSGTTANLDWGNASGATGYRVYRNAVLWASPAASTTSDTELPAGLFLYLVHATDGTSESAD